jgi:hypothetical protein
MAALIERLMPGYEGGDGRINVDVLYSGISLWLCNPDKQTRDKLKADFNLNAAEAAELDRLLDMCPSTEDGNTMSRMNWGHCLRAELMYLDAGFPAYDSAGQARATLGLPTP